MSGSEPALEAGEIATPVEKTSSGWEPSPAGARIILAFLLVEYFLFFCMTMMSKNLWIDELYVFFTAKADSIGRLIHVQIASPLGIEPPLFSILAHEFLILFPHHNRIVRMPAAFGFFLFLLFFFLFLKRLGGAKLAILSTALLLTTSIVYYASEARPYGLMYGMWGCCLFFWQRARHDGRWSSAVLLALATAVGINSHYFALLMPVPLVLGELITWRSQGIARGKVLAAIAVGYATALLWLPFLKGAALYSKNYGRGFELEQLVAAYRLMLSILPLSLLIRNLVSGTFLIFVAAGLILLMRRGVFTPEVQGGEVDRSAEWIAVCAACVVPFLGAGLALKAHGTLEPRYVLYAISGFCALAGVAIGALVASRAALALALGVICAVACLQETAAVKNNRHLSDIEWQPLPPIPASESIVIADFGKFLLMEAQPNVSPKVVYLYDGKEEVKRFNSDYMTHTAVNAAEIGNLPIYSANMFIKDHPDFVVASWRGFDNWWVDAWPDEGLHVSKTQKAGDWTVYSVSAVGVRSKP